MLTCPKCKVTIAGNKEHCPLCQGELTGEPNQDPYLHISPGKYTKHFILKICSFCAVSLIILSIALNMMIATDLYWSIFAIGCTVCLWATVSVGITYRKRLFKNLTFQMFFITIFCILWDIFIGWRGWSLNFVLPCVCIAYMVAIIVLSKVINNGPVNSYVIYLVIDCVLGTTPIIFLLSGVLTCIYPSIICVALSLISLFALLFFEGNALKEEITKKLHI